VAKFCQQQALKQVVNDEDSVRVYDCDGSAFGDTEAERLHAQAQKLIDQTQTLNQQRVAGKQPDITVAEALRMVETKHPATPREKRYRDWAIAAEMETSEAESVDRISLRNYWAEDEEETFDNSHFLLPGGYAQVTAALARGLDIRLGQPVVGVRWSNKGVEVATEKETIAADRVLVTLPLGVLKSGSVQFAPALPAQKLQAIQALGVGAAHRVLLRFERCFWRDDNQLLGYASEELGRFIEWWNYAALAGSPILSFWSHGNAARQLDKAGPQAALEEAMKSLRAIFSSAVTDPVAWLVTNWDADPFSQGAHSFLPVGASYEQLDVLAAPLDQRVFFAGEATSRRHPATVHGAWLSGVREAERIAKAK
jgi:monoamine oxidase